MKRFQQGHVVRRNLVSPLDIGDAFHLAATYKSTFDSLSVHQMGAPLYDQYLL